MKVNNFLKYLGYLVIILGFITWGVVSYFQYFPAKVVEIKEPISIANKENIKAGGYLYYNFKYKKHYNLVANVTYQLIDGYVVLIDGLTSNIPKGEGEYVVSVPIPPEVKEGYYILRITLEYKVSSLRTITEVFETERFYIGPSKDVLTLQKLDIELKKMKIEQEKIMRVQKTHSYTSVDNNTMLRNLEGIVKNQSTILEKIEKLEQKE